MKPGDIVEVFDGSWTMALVDGKLRETGSLSGQKFRVVHIGGEYPTSTSSQMIHQSKECCDIMLASLRDPTFVVFAMSYLCCPTIERQPDAEYIVDVPKRAKRVVLNFT
jgi:hypothetical protein